MKAAIVGCGGIGKAHARAYAAIEGIELLYTIDRVPALADAAAEEFGAKALYDISEMTEKPDIVSVVTPPFAHTEPTLALLRMGIPVFSEKPITMDVEEAKAVAAASAEHGVPVGIGFKMRYEPVFRRAKELIPRLGKLYAVSAVKNQPHHQKPGHWVERVGCMYELSVHEYDLINWIAGLDPVDVQAELCYDFGWERENRAYLDVNYAGGIKGQLLSSYSPDTKFSFHDLSITYVGERGYMRIERPDRIFLHTDTDEIFDVDPASGGNQFEQELRAFIAAVQNGTAPDPDARSGAVTTFMIEAARESAVSGKRTALARI